MTRESAGLAPTIRIVTLAPPHEERLARLFAANRRAEIIGFFDPFPLDAATARRLTRYSGQDRYWGVWSGDELVGLAMVRGWDEGHPQRASGIFVDHQRHGEGIGTAAMRMVVEEMRVAGEPVLRARIHEGNRASLAMLLASGYREIARAEGRILLECTFAEPAR
jgi:RimJ/RimL family protein N-acetyltransferase